MVKFFGPTEKFTKCRLQECSSHTSIFFFFFFTFLHPTAPRNRENYHLPFFFRNSDLKCPKMPISALKFHFFYKLPFFPP